MFTIPKSKLPISIKFQWLLKYLPKGSFLICFNSYPIEIKIVKNIKKSNTKLAYGLSLSLSITP